MSATVFRVLVGTDFSECASRALDQGLEGVRRAEQLELHVVSVIDDGMEHFLAGRDRHASLTQMVDEVRELLTADVAKAVESHSVASEGGSELLPILHVRIGGVAEQIAELATEIRADLVIVGTHGRRGVRRPLMGSVAERTVRLAPCPVLVVRAKDFHAMDGLPALAPACSYCLKERELSSGVRWWCAAHESAREPAHTYSFSGQLTNPSSPRHHML